MPSTQLAVFLLLGRSAAVMYDLVEPLRLAPSECSHGCALWSDLAADGNTRSQSDVDAKWKKGVAPPNANRSCAAPSKDPGTYGSWCYCRDSHDETWGYCRPSQSMPEQLNLQLSTADSVVVSFVTFESASFVTSSPPSCTLTDASGARTVHTGRTVVHQTPQKDRTLFMHFVALHELAPRANYSYSCSSDGSSPSPPLSFRAPYADGPTRLAMFGDMGVYAWNNMGNMDADCTSGAIDAVVHIGDHAYNEGDDDERRGDSYMNMYQPVISRCPWMPVVGNHEYYSGEELERFLDQNWEQHTPEASAHGSSLHALLERGSAAARAAAAGGRTAQSPKPSGSARWYSVDMGLVHLIALDLNVYFGTDDSSLQAAQAEWLRADLAAANANRDVVPWILTTSHYPFYCSECSTQLMTSKWYADGFVFDEQHVEHEHPTMNATEQAHIADARTKCAASGRIGDALCDGEWATTVGASTDKAISDLVPLLHAAGVDMHVAGHWHYYESLFPMGTPAHGTGGAPQQRGFMAPRSTVHVTTGNGGPPSKDTMNSPMAALRSKSNKYGYGRVTATNATHLHFEQVLNGWADEGAEGEVLDEFTIVQPRHGPFPDASH